MGWARGSARRGAGARVGVLVSTAIVLAGCAAAGPPVPSVDEYVDDAIAHMSAGLYAQGDVWQEALANRAPELRDAASVAQTHAGLHELVQIAGGRHSRLLTPGEAAESRRTYGESSDFALPTVRAAAPGVSVLTLPTFNGAEPAAVDRYQDAALRAVADARVETGCGWIVDLRTNGGGNAYPMLSAVAPLLAEGRVLGFTDRDAQTEWISVAAGGLVTDMAQVPPAAPEFSIDQPVAILTGDGTASAAEAVVVAFSGQPRTARFGAPTAGLTTSNTAHDLDDGAVLVVTTAFFEDRAGRVFDGPIEPDSPSASWKTPRVVDEATGWLRTQCA